MIIAREVFMAKPGMASKLAALMKRAMEGLHPVSKFRVMTDLTGFFNTVVMETEFENLGEFEKRMEEYRTNQAVRDRMLGYTEMYQSGTREFYQVM